MITHITDKEMALTTALTRMTEALNQATKERDDLIGFVARCRDSVPAGYAADFESGAIACPEDVASYVAAAFSEMVAERGALKADAGRTKLTRIERECLLIGKEIQRAAGELPKGYELEVYVERGYGGITLRKPDDTTVGFNDAVDGLSHCITQAIDAAMKGTS